MTLRGPFQPQLYYDSMITQGAGPEEPGEEQLSV